MPRLGAEELHIVVTNSTLPVDIRLLQFREEFRVFLIQHNLQYGWNNRVWRFSTEVGSKVGLWSCGNKE